MKKKNLIINMEIGPLFREDENNDSVFYKIECLQSHLDEVAFLIRKQTFCPVDHTFSFRSKPLEPLMT